MSSKAKDGTRKERQTAFLPREPARGGAEGSVPAPPSARAPEESLRLVRSTRFDHDEEETHEGSSPAERLARSPRFNWLRELESSEERTSFRAEEAETGNLVTVELLTERTAADAERVKLFYLEAETAARLQHPHIAQSRAAEPFANTHLRITQHPSGGQSLRELLTLSGWIEPERAMQIIAQVAAALASAHRAGVVHLALQPEQIWLDQEDRLLITGFGITADEPLEWARRLRAVRCAPPYLSPEQLNGQTGNRASDIYALGVIFYEMLTDRVPFDSNDLEQLQRWHRVKAPRPPQSFKPDLPPELCEIVMAWLDRDPHVRAGHFDQLDGFSAQPAPAPAVAAAPAVADAPKTRPSRAAMRMTNPMPLSELAAEVSGRFGAATSTHAPAKIESASAATSEFMPPPPAPNAPSKVLDVARRWWPRNFRGISIVAVVLYVSVLLLVLYLFQSTRNIQPRTPQGEETDAATSGATQAPDSGGGRVAASPAPPGQNQNSSTSSATGEELLAPVALPGGSVWSAPPAGTDGPASAGNFIFGVPVRRVGPTYPADAQGLAGVVVVEALVDEQGRVTQVRALSGPRIFRKAALDAARQWQFLPTTLNGAPVKAHRKITFQFDGATARNLDAPTRPGRDERN